MFQVDIRENLLNALTGGECVKNPVTSFPAVLTTQQLSMANATFDEACHDAEKMAEVAGLLYDYTSLEGITIPLDLWFEVESFDYIVQRQAGSLTPIVTKAPFDMPEDIELPQDFICKGQFPAIEKASKILHERYDDENVLNIAYAIESMMDYKNQIAERK